MKFGHVFGDTVIAKYRINKTSRDTEIIFGKRNKKREEKTEKQTREEESFSRFVSTHFSSIK